MATVHRYDHRSSYFLACYTGPEKERVQFATKLTDRGSAQAVAVALEQAARLARAGTLTQEKVGAILETLPSLDPDIGEKIRKRISQYLILAGGDSIADETTRAWCLSWLEDQRGSNAPGTCKRYGGTVHEFLAFIGPKANKSLRHLSIRDVQNFRDNQVQSGVADASANLAVKTLRTCLNLAVGQGYTTHNRANAVKLRRSDPKGRHFKKPFTHGQVELLARCAPSREWRELINCGYYIGDRLGNLVELGFENFNLEAGTVTYTPGKQRRDHTPKELTIPLHPSLHTLISAHAKKKGPVFPVLSQRKVSGKTGLSLQFRSLMEKAGITCERKEKSGPRGRTVFSLGFHSLRRSFNSDLANSSVSQELRQKLVGHASKEVNDRYTSLELETLRAAIVKLPALSIDSTDPSEVAKTHAGEDAYLSLPALKLART